MFGHRQCFLWLHNAVKKCADHHIMVDIHDEYRPTGWSRTYPNLMTQEGIGGNEEMPDAEHNTILPFTRFLCGPADYTPCYFNGRVKNTKAHQLAMPVVYYSPITFLYWYDLPNVYKGENELDFWKHCPTVWDDSKALQGEIGEYIVEARRSGSDWFVGAMNGLQARQFFQEVILSEYLSVKAMPMVTCRHSLSVETCLMRKIWTTVVMPRALPRFGNFRLSYRKDVLVIVSYVQL